MTALYCLHLDVKIKRDRLLTISFYFMYCNCFTWSIPLCYSGIFRSGRYCSHSYISIVDHAVGVMCLQGKCTI
jgi:hypothetical protein